MVAPARGVADLAALAFVEAPVAHEAPLGLGPGRPRQHHRDQNGNEAFHGSSLHANRAATVFKDTGYRNPKPRPATGALPRDWYAQCRRRGNKLGVSPSLSARLKATILSTLILGGNCPARAGATPCRGARMLIGAGTWYTRA